MDFLTKLKNFAGSLLGQAGQAIQSLPAQMGAMGQMIQQGAQQSTPIQQRFQSLNPVNYVQAPQIQVPKLNITTPQIDWMGISNQANQTKNSFINYLGKYASEQMQKPLLGQLPAGPTIGNTLGFAKSALLETPARAIASAELQGFGIKHFTPENNLQKFFLGSDQINSFSQNKDSAKQLLQSWGIKDQGLSDKLAMGLVGAGTFMDAVPLYGSGKKKVADVAIEKSPKVLSALEEVASRLSKINVFNYHEELLNRGYTPAQINKISFTEYKKLVSEGQNVKLGLKGWLKDKFTPLLNQSKDIQEATTTWDRTIKTATVDANQVNSKFQTLVKSLNIDPQTEWKLIQWSQRPTQATADLLGLSKEIIVKAKPLLLEHKKFNDELYSLSKASKIDLNYLQNHILQSFQETPAQIQDIMKSKGLSGIPGFAKKRIIPDYLTATQDFKLTPRYTTFGQANAQAFEQLQKAVANQKYADFLTKSGQLKPASKAPLDWVEITAPFFPKISTKNASGEIVQESYRAEPALGNFLNHLFGGQPQGTASKILETTGNISKTAQNVLLSSAGLTFNAFTKTQALKDIFTGIGDVMTLHPIRGIETATGGIRAIMRGFIPGLSVRFEKEHMASIREMASQGIKYAGKLSYQEGQKNVVKGKGILGKAGDTWHAVIDSPTFQKFLWQRQVQLYETFRDSLMRSGLGKSYTYDEASTMAANQLRKYDGFVEAMGRDPDIVNLMDTFVFAPIYRQNLLGSGLNIVRGVFDIKNPQYSASRSLGIGLIASAYIFNEYNKSLNGGEGMGKNVPGHTTDIQIPDKNVPGHYTWISPYSGMQAVFIRPITAIQKLLGGDLGGAAKDASFLASVPITNLGYLSSGKDYFGRDIYKNPDQVGVGDVAGAAAKLFMPSPLQTLANYQQKAQAGKNPNPGIYLAQGFEMPIREGTNSVYYFNAQKDALKTLTPNQQQVYLDLNKGKERDENGLSIVNSKQDSMANAMLRLANPEVVAAETNIALVTAQKTNTQPAPFYLLPPEKQRIVLWTQASPPGAEKSNLQKQNISWLKTYWDQNSAYFKSLNLPPSNTPQAPQASAYVQQQMDNKNWGDPAVSNYLTANTNYKNEQRVAMGLPELPASGGFTPFPSTGKKIAFKSAPKLKSTKLKLISKAKMPKLLKIKSSKQVALKVPKLKFPAMKARSFKSGGAYA